MTLSLSRAIPRAWQKDSAWLIPLRPLSALTARVARRRLRHFRRRGRVSPVPVLVVGNITVGGTGKTPLVIALCEALRQRGLRVAVISRGYGARPPAWPWPVNADSDPMRCGDEPVVIARDAAVPVTIDPDRARALSWTLERDAPDLVISDDGLQHYGLPRTAELVVVDADTGFGNGRCLPAGPLREPAARLDEVEWVVALGELQDWPDAWSVTREPGEPFHWATGKGLAAAVFRNHYPSVHAVAGIGRPEQFFQGLREQGLEVIEHPRPDHHVYRTGELDFDDARPVVMTAKDAVKCDAGDRNRLWVWPAELRLPANLVDAIAHRLTAETTP